MKSGVKLLLVALFTAQALFAFNLKEEEGDVMATDSILTCKDCK